MPSSTNAINILEKDHSMLEGMLKERLMRSGMLFNVMKLSQKLNERSKISVKFFADESSEKWNVNTLFMGAINIIGLARTIIVFDAPANGPSKEAILRVLAVLDWKSELQFEGVDNQIAPDLMEVGKKHGHILQNDPIGLYYMTKEEANQLLTEKDLKIINGPEVRGTSLRPSDAVMVQDRWPEKVPGYLEMLEASIELCSSGGIYQLSDNAPERLVSHAVALPFGSIHAFHTEEDQRRKGFGKLTMKVLAKNIATAGRIPLVQIYKDNDGSKALNEGIGFKYSHDINLIIYKPQ